MNIIKQKRLEKNMTLEQLGDLVGVGKSTVRKWENGIIENLRRDSIVSLAKALDISPLEILGMDETELKSDIEVIYNQLEPPRQNNVYNFAKDQLDEQNKIIHLSDYIDEDLYGYASAGTGQQVFDNPVETVKIPISDVPTQKYDIVLQVVGDSMEPAFKDHEYIFVRKTESLRNGQFGVFIINGESYLKKVYVEDDHLRLVSLNEKYPDLLFTADDGITLVGQVVL